MKYVTKQLSKSGSILSLLVAVMVLFAFTGTMFAQQAPMGIVEDIPDGANRIIMVQEGVPPADVYVDTYNLLRTKDFQITASEESLVLSDLRDILNNEPLVFAAKKQIRDDMALWMTFNVNTTPAGGQLIASAKYAEDVNTPVGEWKQAAWTSGKAEEAFIEALDVIRHARYDAMDFEVGVAVVSR